MALLLKCLTPSIVKSWNKITNSRLGNKIVNKCMSREKTTALPDAQRSSVDKPILKTSSNKLASYNIKDRISGFVVKEVEEIPEFQLIAIKLVHEATGGEYLHIDRDDSNNAFSVIFRTTPTNSTGLPHILEHTALCGSHKYPCRDPFFKMLNRSLSTFMNAITAADFTMYPFLTQNQKDFENLMSVYLDAVFQPMLTESDFAQEGWRLEHLNPKDSTTPIVIKGVVYNEMKGFFSDNQKLFHLALMNNILPSNTYGVCSGGNPLDIPALTHADLKNFHKNYYSPLNAKYYSYGNFPLEKHLHLLNVQYLNKFKWQDKDRVSTPVPLEKRWTEPVRKHITCRVDPLAADKNKQSCIGISVLCCSIVDVEECLLLGVLSNLLVDGPNSSFYSTLIEPNIGAGFSPVTGYESQTKDTYFALVLQGVSDKDFDKIIQIYNDTIDNVIKTGFSKEDVDGNLNSIELNLKHQVEKFGLDLLLNIAPVWNHEGDVINCMRIESHIEKLKQKIAQDPEFLQKMVKKYFKDNKHQLILTMSPDPNYDKVEKEKENVLINEKIKKLNEEEKRQIYKNGLKLLELQNVDDKSCLPTLKLSDLKKNVESVPMLEKKVDDISVYMIPQLTNGITYFTGLMSLGDLSEDLKAVLPLFVLVSTSMGTKKRNYKEFHQISALTTGGLSIGTHLKNDTSQLDITEENLILNSYCLNKNLDSMFDLWLEIFEEMELSDMKRFETLVKFDAATLANSIISSGYHYVIMSSASLVSRIGLLKEKRSGLTYVNSLNKIVQGDLSEVLTKMTLIKDKVMNRSRLRCAFNVLQGTEDDVFSRASRFIQNVRGTVEKSEAPEKLSLANASTKGIFHVFPIPISYTGKTVIAVPYEHEDYSALQVMARLLTAKYLHKEIREKGGAYGGGVDLSSFGLLNFYSHDDPNPANSHATFDNSLSWLKTGDFSLEDMDEAKLGLFKHIDAPVPPGAKGMRWFLHGITDEMFRRHRLRVMEVTKDNVIEVGEKYLGERNVNPVGRATIGPENKEIMENSEHNWTAVKLC